MIAGVLENNNYIDTNSNQSYFDHSKISANYQDNITGVPTNDQDNITGVPEKSSDNSQSTYDQDDENISKSSEDPNVNKPLTTMDISIDNNNSSQIETQER